jgi:molecular chaperone HscB
MDPQETKEGKLDYFQVLGLPRKYELSKQMLSSSFRALQAKLHPDRFAVASEKEKAISSDSSSLVNRAYSVLKDPLARGLHLLELQGLTLEEGATSANAEFLMEVMEINEEITAKQGSVEALSEMNDVNEKKIDEHAQLLADAFRKKDYNEARRILAEMKYFENIREKLRSLGVGDEM